MNSSTLKLSKIIGRNGINFSDVPWLGSNMCILRALALIHKFLAITFHNDLSYDCSDTQSPVNVVFDY